MGAWIYIISGGILILVGGVLAGYDWHIMPRQGSQTERSAHRTNVQNDASSSFQDRLSFAVV